MKSKKRPEWPTLTTAAELAECKPGTLIMWESLPDALHYGWAELLDGRWWIGDHAFDHATMMNGRIAHVVWYFSGIYIPIDGASA